MKKVMTLFSRRLAVFAAISLFATQAFSQELKMGLNLGCNYTDLAFDKKAFKTEIENANDFRFGIGAGAGYEITVAGVLLAPEISYDFGLNEAKRSNQPKYSSVVLSMSILF
jgi:hypothetical protein